MKSFSRSLIIYLILSVLAACSMTPEMSRPADPTETAAFTQTKASPTNVPSLPTSTLSPQAIDAKTGTLSPALTMTTGRAAHTATLLPDGRVLLAGGFRSAGTAEIPIASAEIYDPGSGQFTRTADMNEARSGHTATLLPDGQVLIVGGWTEGERSSTAELYDPVSGSFRMAASMSAPRASMTATLLKDGTVLIAGGDSARDTPQLVAEIYDHATNTFTQTSSLNHGRSAHAAAMLKDGRVLLSGGHSDYSPVQASVEVYDPTTGEFTQTGSLNTVRRKHAAVPLQDGRVLVVGGSSQDDWHNQYNSAEIYDPGTGTFTPTADLNAERFKLVDAAVLLNDGNVLVAGGSRQVELFDVQSVSFVVVGHLDDPYYFSAATPLQDGRVLISGGYDPDIQPSDRAWIYTPN